MSINRRAKKTKFPKIGGASRPQQPPIGTPLYVKIPIRYWGIGIGIGRYSSVLVLVLAGVGRYWYWLVLVGIGIGIGPPRFLQLTFDL